MNKLTVVATAGALILGATAGSAHAQESSRKQEVEVYAGAVTGDHVTSESVSGRNPKLDDDLVIGARYTYELAPTFGLQLSAGYSPNAVVDTPDGDIDVDLTVLDLNAIWMLRPGEKFVPYLALGIGYANASFDHRLQGTVGTTPVSIGGESGVTANAGIGAKYYFDNYMFVGLDARYRYIDKLTDKLDHRLDTGEVTLAIGYRF